VAPLFIALVHNQAHLITGTVAQNADDYRLALADPLSPWAGRQRLDLRGGSHG